MKSRCDGSKYKLQQPLSTGRAWEPHPFQMVVATISAEVGNREGIEAKSTKIFRSAEKVIGRKRTPYQLECEYSRKVFGSAKCDVYHGARDTPQAESCKVRQKYTKGVVGSHA